SEFLQQLPLPANEKWQEGVWDTETFRHGSMSLILFAPRGEDYQTPHDQDELYFVVKGSGDLVVEKHTFSFSAGDVLFVPAGKFHRFENFSDDLATWAVFWGPIGGEAILN